MSLSRLISGRNGRNILIAALLVLAAALGLVGRAAAECIEYEDYLHVTGLLEQPGSATGVALDASLAYVVYDEGDLVIVDLGIPSQPVVLGSASTGEFMQGLALAGDRVYVAAGNAGLLTFDVGDPSAPQLLGGVATTCAARKLVLADSHLVAVESYGYGLCSYLEVFDLANPDSPLLVGTLPLGSWVSSLDVGGDIAYVGDEDGPIWIVDLSSPSTPVILGQYSFVESYCNGLTVQGNTLYAVQSFLDWVDGDVTHSLVVLDVSDPTQPIEAGFSAYLGMNSSPTIVAAGDHLFSLTQYLMAFDISDPWAPQYQGRLEMFGRGALAVQGGIAVAPLHAGLIAVLELGNQQAASLIGGIGINGYPDAIVYRHPYAFMAATGASYHSNRGLVVIDATDPSDPQIVYTDNTRSCYDLTLAGDWIYAIAYEGQEDWSLEVFDVSDPSAPQAVGSCDLPNRCWGLDCANGYVYAACVEQGLRILSVADPANPQIVGAMPTGDWAMDIAVQGDVACIANRYDGLRVVDVSDPASPATISTLDLGGYCGHVALRGTRAVLNGITGNFLVVDIADPSAPVLLGTTLTLGGGNDLSLRGDLALAVGGRGLEFVNLSDPTQPRLVGNIVTPLIESTAAFGDESIFIGEQTNGGGGFQVAPIPCTITSVENAPASPEPGSIVAYPNPFNPQTTFRFELATAGPVHLELYDISGRLVATPLAGRVFTAGVHELSWQSEDDAGQPLSSGVYLYRLQAAGRTQEGKLTLLK